MTTKKSHHSIAVIIKVFLNFSSLSWGLNLQQILEQSPKNNEKKKETLPENKPAFSPNPAAQPTPSATQPKSPTAQNKPTPNPSPVRPPHHKETSGQVLYCLYGPVKFSR